MKQNVVFKVSLLLAVCLFAAMFSPAVLAQDSCEYTYFEYTGTAYDYSESKCYVDYFGDGTVYIGGNARSGRNNGTVFDNDPNDFHSILPYGTVFIDANKLT